MFELSHFHVYLTKWIDFGVLYLGDALFIVMALFIFRSELSLLYLSEPQVFSLNKHW